MIMKFTLERKKRRLRDFYQERPTKDDKFIRIWVSDGSESYIVATENILYDPEKIKKEAEAGISIGKAKWWEPIKNKEEI